MNDNGKYGYEFKMPDIMDVTDIAFPHLGIYLHNIPKSISIFGFSIAFYGIIIGIGMLLGVALAAKQIEKMGEKADTIWDVAVYILVFSVIGARAYYVIFSWDHYKNDLLSIFNTRKGGMAIYGGVIGGLLTILIYCAIKKINCITMTDACVCGLTLGQLMGRYGNFFNREAFGEYTDNLFAMRLPIEAVRQSDISENIAAHIIDGTNYIQVHPTFFYESCWNIALLLILLYVVRHRRFAGQVALTYFGGYGIGRFWIEALRTDQLLIPGTSIAVSRVVALAMLVVAIVGYVVGIRYAKSHESSEVPESKTKTTSESETKTTSESETTVS